LLNDSFKLRAPTVAEKQPNVFKLRETDLTEVPASSFNM
jgi:hypothetical protein